MRVRYLHSDIDTLERIEILRDLRRASSTCWSASTSCARGSTCPRCRWSAILDADKEGFLRAERSLIQTIGRAARNVRGKVIMYADRETDSMKKAIDETRAAARDPGGVQPRSTASRPRRSRRRSRSSRAAPRTTSSTSPSRPGRPSRADIPLEELPQIISAMRREMFDLSEALEFEKAAALRDRIKELEEIRLSMGTR